YRVALSRHPYYLPRAARFSTVKQTNLVQGFTADDSPQTNWEAIMTALRMLAVFLLVIFVLGAGPAQAHLTSELGEYSHGNVRLKAYMAYDDKVTGGRPAVLMIHAREGM